MSRIVKRSERAIGRWVRGWNKHGYDGLMPHFTGGPKPKMPAIEWDKIVKEIENKGMTLKDVVVYVNDMRGIHYGYNGVRRFSRREKKVGYGKAYKMNVKRPANAEGILKKD